MFCEKTDIKNDELKENFLNDEKNNNDEIKKMRDEKNNNDEIKKMRDEKNKKIKKNMPVFLTDLLNFLIPVTIILGTIFLICFCI